VLAMTVDAAYTFFEGDDALSPSLSVLREVGLGYIRLGQSATELSGVEAQRVKLATELQRAQRGGTLYILDEPTTGLHPTSRSLAGSFMPSSMPVLLSFWSSTTCRLLRKAIGSSMWAPEQATKAAVSWHRGRRCGLRIRKSDRNISVEGPLISRSEVDRAGWKIS
jgi:hypothetical protein